MDERAMQLSLDGARLGRRAGFIAARHRAAMLVMEHVQDVGEAMRLKKMILELEDK
jgi:hypothetical protein